MSPSSNNNISQFSKIKISIASDLNESLIPQYLNDTYWWAYINENAVWFWERQWLVNTILWGNFNKLKLDAINEINDINDNKNELNISQIACVYGNFSNDLISKISSINIGNIANYNYNIIDIAPIQLTNAKLKIHKYLELNSKESNSNNININLYQNNSINLLSILTESQNILFLFFLLHEQPKHIRLQTINEAIRVTKKYGKIVIVDYHKPISNINPLKYIMYPILTVLEPFAIDLWNEQITEYIESYNTVNKTNITIRKKIYFNGLYQKLVLIKQ